MPSSKNGRLTSRIDKAAYGAASSAGQQLRPVFKVHGIEVVPFAAPDEAVLLEDRDDLLRHAVAIRDRQATRFVVRLPEPVIGISGVEIDGDAVAVWARCAGIRHRAAIVGAGDRIGGALDGIR